MPSMTLAIPEDLHQLIRKHNEIRWSEIARRAMWEYANRLNLMDDMLKDSKLTEEDATRIANKVKKGIHKHHMRKLDEASDRH
ncbi:MAG: hypothetical protein MUC62_02605 [Candidatus Thermoplasmatota archaeon]|nr:hypothetical protein [Candidatus Thermoplasmatota archaeon]